MSKTKSRKFSLPAFKSRTSKQDVEEFLMPTTTNNSPAIPTSPSLENLQQQKNTTKGKNTPNNNESSSGQITFGRTSSAGNRLMGSDSSPGSSDEEIVSNNKNYLLVPNGEQSELEGSSSTSGTSPKIISNRKVKTPPTMSPPSSPRSLLQWFTGRKQDQTSSSTERDSDLKIGLFGCEGSGKSTLFKQCEKIIGGQYAQKAVFHSATFIQQNLVEVLRTLFEGILKEQELNGDVALDWTISQKMKNFISKHASENFIGDKVIDAPIWHDVLQDSRVKEILDNIHDHKNLNYSIGNCVEYYISEYERLTSPDYKATNKDYITFQQRTTGVISRLYTHKDKAFCLMDLGGVRTERRKWSAVMKCCQALVYVASLSEFDEVCWEDISTNRFIEDLTTFNEWIKNDSIKNQPVFLVLTNVDRFKKKIDSPNKVSILNSLLSIGNDETRDEDFYLKAITNKFKEVDQCHRICDVIVTNSLDTDDLETKISQIFDKIVDKCK